MPVSSTPYRQTTRLPFAVVEMNRPVTDPVCGQTITQATAKASLGDADGLVCFCSWACRELYAAALRRP